MTKCLVICRLFLCGLAMGSAEAGADAVVHGRWLEHVPDTRVRMDETGKSLGWQTSDLTYDAHTRTWWSVGDQNSREQVEDVQDGQPYRGGFVYRFRQLRPVPQAQPIEISWEEHETEFAAVDASFRPGSIDYEGIVADPVRPNTFFLCTEGSQPWLVEAQYFEAEQKFVVTCAVRISTRGNHDRDKFGKTGEANPNKRWEAITLSPDGQTIFLGTEWINSPSRIYQVPKAEFYEGEWKRDSAGRWIAPEVLPKPFPAVGIEGELTGLCFVSDTGKTYLAALERNRAGNSPPGATLYFFDMTAPQTPFRKIALDLRAPALDGRPGGIRIKSGCVEGMASDGAGRIALLSDPALDFYQSLEPGADERMFNTWRPLVFETSVTDLLGSRFKTRPD